MHRAVRGPADGGDVVDCCWPVGGGRLGVAGVNLLVWKCLLAIFAGTAADNSMKSTGEMSVAGKAGVLGNLMNGGTGGAELPFGHM